MRAFPNDPDHFRRRLVETSLAERFDCDVSFCFVPRRIYRDYLGDLIAPFCGPGGRLALVDGECADIRPLGGGVAVELSDGRVEVASLAMLATGHANRAPSPARGSSALVQVRRTAVGPDDGVIILGAGLSMVDNVATPRRMGHRGTITALSRRGLVPQPHAPSRPLPLRRRRTRATENEAMVGQDLFQAVQARLSEQSERPRGSTLQPDPHLLGGLV